MSYCFKLHQTEIGPGCWEIDVEGELDLGVVDELQAAIESCGEGDVLIGLASCQFMDSSAIAAILAARRRGSPRVTLHSPSAQVLRLLEVTGLAGRGLVFPDRQRALDGYLESAMAEPSR